MSPLPLPSQTLAWLNHAANAGQRDAQALLHLIARADKHDQDVAVFVDSYTHTIAAICRRLEALERGVNDLTAPAAPVDDSLIRMVLIPAGRFLMGSPANESSRSRVEGPQHEVTLASFFMAQTPITQAQWRAVAGWQKQERDLDPDPSYFKGANRPVEMVSWFDALEFCRRLSQRTGQRYGLPSEAQWEYACRAGSTTPFHFGATLTPELANCGTAQTTEVASFPANPWGLHDMHGNVWEWCLDEWHNNYDGAPTDGGAWTEVDSLGKCCAAGRGAASPRAAERQPASTASPRTTATTASVSASVASPDRLLRGGSWNNNPGFCRSASRNGFHPDGRYGLGIGFRVVCLPQD
jgi:formylglycine-generating enzyme required for sulfatase activity